MSQARMTEILERQDLKNYDSNSHDTTPAFMGADIAPASPSKQMLIYVTQESLAKFNGSAKEVYLPKDAWTPIGFEVETFNIKTVTEAAGKAYWQSWY